VSDVDSTRELDKELGIEVAMGATSATGGPRPERVGKPKRRLKGFRMGFWLSAGWMGLVTFLAVFAGTLPFIKPYAKTYGDCAGDGPSVDHWLGCDNIGRDLFSRIAYGGRVSLFIGLMVVLLSIVVGGAIGLFAGYYRGKTDTIMTTIIDTILAIPPLILLLFVVIVLGQNIKNIVIAVGILAIPTTARIVRANTMVFAEREFVTAAKVLGAKNRRIIWREILPNVIPPLVSYTFLAVGIIIVVEGILSFLGASIPPPEPTWGKIIAEGRTQMDTHPLIALLPGLVIFFTVLSLNIISDAVREKFDVRQAGI
jgi:ABC-type dipeptide/oligopeptide/nickel transport system permease subunit